MIQISKKDIEAIDVCINCLKSAHFGLSEGSAMFSMVESAYLLQDLKKRIFKHLSEQQTSGFDQVKIIPNEIDKPKEEEKIQNTEK